MLNSFVIRVVGDKSPGGVPAGFRRRHLIKCIIRDDVVHRRIPRATLGFPPKNMKNPFPPRMARSRGMTFIELTVTIAVLLVLISAVLIGSRAWKRGGDRANCLLNIRNVQVSARSYQNLYGYSYSGHPYAENGTQNIASHLLSKGYIEKPLFDQICGKKPCPGGGTYSCPNPDIFPAAGRLYVSCSLGVSESHTPDPGVDW